MFGETDRCHRGTCSGVDLTYAASSGRDTDFTAKLVDVFPMGAPSTWPRVFCVLATAMALNVPNSWSLVKWRNIVFNSHPPAISSKWDTACAWRSQEATSRASTAISTQVKALLQVCVFRLPTRPSCTRKATPLTFFCPSSQVHDKQAVQDRVHFLQNKTVALHMLQ